MSIDTTVPDIAERLTSAGNATDLTVDLDRRRPVDLLIAAGLAPSVVGRLLDQLVSEWDGCAKPRRLTTAEIERVAAAMPRTPGRKGGKADRLDIAGATSQVATWFDNERRAAMIRLKTLPKLTDPHAGLIPWLAAKGVQAAGAVLLDVLGWYLDRCCPRCNGTKWEVIAGTHRQSAKACHACDGRGERPIPHGQLGRLVISHLEGCASHARAGTKKALTNMKALKYAAAGRRM